VKVTNDIGGSSSTGVKIKPMMESENAQHAVVREELRRRRATKIKMALAVILLIMTIVSTILYVKMAQPLAHLATLCSGLSSFLTIIAVSHAVIFVLLLLWGISFWRMRKDVYGPVDSIPRLRSELEGSDHDDDELLVGKGNVNSFEDYDPAENNMDVEINQLPKKKKRGCCFNVAAGLVILILTLMVIINVVVYELVMPRVGTTELPKTLDNTLLNHTVTIEYGEKSMIHIKAKTKWDVYFAQGLVTAQQRLWQMEFQRSVGNGKLSSIVGPGALDTDIIMRTYGFDAAAKRAVSDIFKDELGHDARLALKAFTEGVNAYLDTDPRLPLEFLVLGHTPEKWGPADSMVWFKVMSLDLSGNYAMEMQRFKLLTEQCVSPERIEELFPPQDLEKFPTVLHNGDPLLVHPPKFDNYSMSCDEPADQLAFLRTLRCKNQTTSEKSEIHRQGRRFTQAWDHTNIGGKNPVQASNNWVTSNTASGKGLLCNDPHLALLAPSLWILFHLEAEEGNFSVIGTTFAGAPGIVIGHNRHIAWGVTNTGVDVQDFFVVRENQLPPGFNITSRKERFPISGKKTETRTIRTVFGPTGKEIGPIMTDNGVNTVTGGLHLALKWVSIDPVVYDTTFISFIKLNEAKNFSQFRNALSYYVAPAQNFVFADSAGNIGYQMPGITPVRVNYTGKFPSELVSEDPWPSYVDFDDMPYTFNPPRGFIASANNQVVPSWYQGNVTVLSCDWCVQDGYRAGRIEQMLKANMKHTVDTMKEIQLDYVSHVFRDFKPIINRTCQGLSGNVLCEVLVGTENGQQGWDGNTTVGSTEATIFANWFTNILGLTQQETGKKFWDNVPFISMSLTAAFNNVSTCCGKNTSAQYRSYAIDATKTINSQLDFTNIPRWGMDVHKALFKHTIFDGDDLTRCIGNRETQHGGDAYTVNVGSYNLDDPAMTQGHGPSYRHIVDFGDQQKSLFLNPLGQSGVIIDPHYDDLLPLWSSGEYLEMKMDNYKVEKTDIIQK